MGSTEERSILQSLCDQFLSMQHSGTSVSLKCWFDGNQKLRFFMTNGPYKNRSQPTPPRSTALETCGGLSSTAFSRAPSGSRPFPPSPEVVRNEPPVNPLNVSIIEDERNTCEDETTAVPNVPTMNRFEILMKDDDTQLDEPVSAGLLPNYTQTDETQTLTKETQYIAARCANWKSDCRNVDNLIPRLQMCETCFKDLLPYTYMELFWSTDKTNKNFEKWLNLKNQNRNFLMIILLSC